MPKKPPQPPEPEVVNDGVVHVRCTRETKIQLASIAARYGCSSNDLASGAFAEFVEVVKQAEAMEAGLGSDYDPEDFLRVLGLSWVHRLSAMGIAGEGMKTGWRQHLAGIDHLKREHAADQAEKRKGGKP